MRLRLLATLLCLLSWCPAAPAAPTQAWLTYFIHTEPNDKGQNITYESEASWARVRRNIVEFAQMVEQEGLALEVLFSKDFIEAEQGWGNKPQYRRQTGGRNLFAWLDGLARVEVGAHVDENYVEGYNYADVVKMLLDMGVPDHGIVGGTFYDTAYAGNYTQFFDGQKAMNSDFVWHPAIIHGLASYNHEMDFVDPGIWRPSRDNAYAHDPDGSLISVGGHRFSTSTAMAALGRQGPELMNVFGLFISESPSGFDNLALNSPRFLEQAAADIALWRAADGLQWGVFTDLARVWGEQYGGRPSLDPAGGLWPAPSPRPGF